MSGQSVLSVRGIDKHLSNGHYTGCQCSGFEFTTLLPPCHHTITDDHAGLQRFVSEGLVADAAGPLVDIEEAAHAVACTVKVVQPRIPQSRTGERIQQVT